MNVLFIFLLGLVILVGAIALNGIGSMLGLPSWYEFIQKPSSVSLLSYGWLFIVYPFGLGMLAFWGARLFGL